jgi:ABC-type xylose transport system substrate-binding protein
MLNSMIAQGVDVILLAPREEKPLVPAVMAAKKAGIPVIEWFFSNRSNHRFDEFWKERFH